LILVSEEMLQLVDEFELMCMIWCYTFDLMCVMIIFLYNQIKMLD